MQRAQVAGDDAEYDDLRVAIARSIHEAHGGAPLRDCFLCLRSAAVSLQALYDNGFVIVAAATA